MSCHAINAAHLRRASTSMFRCSEDPDRTQFTLMRRFFRLFLPSPCSSEPPCPSEFIEIWIKFGVDVVQRSIKAQRTFKITPVKTSRSLKRSLFQWKSRLLTALEYFVHSMLSLISSRNQQHIVFVYRYVECWIQHNFPDDSPNKCPQSSSQTL